MIDFPSRAKPLWVLVASLVAFSASADAPTLSGSYRYVPEQSNEISKAIDAAVEKMNFIKRPIARSRLNKTNTAYQQIRLELSATDVDITFDSQKPIRVPLGGRSIKWTRADGEVFDVSATFDGTKLIQTYKAEDGMRVNAFHQDASGSLHLNVEVSSPQLPQPVRYELVYRSAS